MPPRPGQRFAALWLATLVLAACGGTETTAPESIAAIVVAGAPTAPMLDGSSVQLIATPLSSTGTVVANGSVSWKSSDASIAAVSAGGQVTAVGAGQVTITAYSAAAEGSAVLEIRAGGPVTSAGGTLDMLGGAVSLVVPAGAMFQTTTIMLAPTVPLVSIPRLVPGTAFDLTPAGIYAPGMALSIRYDPARLPAGTTEGSLQLYTYRNSAWSVVAGSTVSAATHRVTGTVSTLGTYAVISTAVERVAISGAAASGALYTAQTGTLIASAYDAVNNLLIGRQASWATSDASKATVDATGKVTAVAPGTVTITATVEDKSASTVVEILARPVADWSQAGEWTTHQGSATHTGYVPATLDPGVFTQRWAASLGTGMVNQVAAGDGAIFATTSGYFTAGSIFALDAMSGQTRWTQALGTNNATMAPTFADGAVFVQTNDMTSYLWSFGSTTGTSRFRVSYTSQWSTFKAPVVVNGIVYMGCGYGDGLCANSATDGSVRWFAATNQYDGWTPAVSGGIAYAYTGIYSPKMQAIDALSGVQLYEIADPNFNWDGYTMNGAPVLGGMNDVLATQNARLVSFDLANRRIGWERKSSFRGGVTVASGVLYVFNGQQVEARNESDGSLLWLWVPPEPSLTETMVVTKNLLFVSTGTKTYALDLASHRAVWSFPAGGRLALSAQGVLLISGNTGTLTAVTVK